MTVDYTSARGQSTIHLHSAGAHLPVDGRLYICTMTVDNDDDSRLYICTMTVDYTSAR